MTQFLGEEEEGGADMCNRVERFAFIQKLLWSNAKFGQLKFTPDLEGVAWRIQVRRDYRR